MHQCRHVHVGRIPQPFHPHKLCGILQVKSGVPPRSPIEYADHLCSSIGISTEAKRQYCEISIVLHNIW